MTTPSSEPSNHSSAPDDAPPFRYTAKLAGTIETQWQNWWESQRTFVQPNPGEVGFDPTRPKYFVLDMFPYPSGAGLHVGHPEGYTATDIIGRYKRMKGCNVLHVMGWDAFGLPAEQYAIQTGVHPAITTRRSIDTFRRQLKRFGFGYDWSREVGTIDEDYYRWTQWIFLKLYDSWFDPQAESPAYPDGQRRRGCARPIGELIAQLESGDLRVGLDGELIHIGAAASNPIPGAEPVGTRRWHELNAVQQREIIDGQRLAYLDEMTVNWCPALGTVLANDEVIDGKSERGGHPVLRKPLKQWQLRITTYAQRLLDDLKLVNWPSSTRTMQEEWIGRSEGAEIDFEVVAPGHKDLGVNGTLRVFTTRPDTLFGATYMVIAPEHPLVQMAVGMNPGGQGDAVRSYASIAKNRSEVDRMADGKDKTGVFTGLYAINPATGKQIPIWTADYVLMGYGTGAIMAVPAHDERDWEFAKKFHLPIVAVISAPRNPGKGWVVRVTDGSLSVETLSSSALQKYKCLGMAGAQRDKVTWFNFGADRAGAELFASEQLGAHRYEIVEETIHDATFLPFTGDGQGINSSNSEVSLNGLNVSDAKKTIITWLERKGIGTGKTIYRLRDWVFSRQRYWGEPIPIVFDDHGRHYPVRFDALPVVLPDLADYSPVESDDPQPLLAKATTWVNTSAGSAGVAANVLEPHTLVKRETNTMPGSAGSSWYFLRYCDPKNATRFVSREAERYWMGHSNAGVDLYIGGSEHAVGHLLYSRFWHKLLFDMGEVSTPEPFDTLFHQGMITSFAYQRPDKTIVPMDEVREESDGVFVEIATGQKLAPIVTKMSKRYKNVINPDDVIAQFGADTFRLYEMYMGPLDASKPWNTKDTIGCFRFLQRLWRLCVDEQTGALRTSTSALPEIDKQLHRTIAKVDADIPRLAFNTAIAALIEFVNAATSATAATGGLTRDQLDLFIRIAAPFAPHVAEDLWHKLGHHTSIADATFPIANPALLVDAEIEVPISIDGKVKHKIMVPRDADKDALEKLAMADAKVQELIAGKQLMKVIAVPGKMVNLVLK